MKDEDIDLDVILDIRGGAINDRFELARCRWEQRNNKAVIVPLYFRKSDRAPIGSRTLHHGQMIDMSTYNRRRDKIHARSIERGRTIFEAAEEISEAIRGGCDGRE